MFQKSQRSLLLSKKRELRYHQRATPPLSLWKSSKNSHMFLKKGYRFSHRGDLSAYRDFKLTTLEIRCVCWEEGEMSAPLLFISIFFQPIKNKNKSSLLFRINREFLNWDIKDECSHCGVTHCLVLLSYEATSGAWSPTSLWRWNPMWRVN